MSRRSHKFLREVEKEARRAEQKKVAKISPKQRTIKKDKERAITVEVNLIFGTNQQQVFCLRANPPGNRCSFEAYKLD